MEEILKQFHTQFAFTPTIVHGERLGRAQHIIVGGMGGSRLSAGIIAGCDPQLDIHVHMDYGLPVLRGEAIDHHLLIASSYSGDTEETLDFAKNALARNLPLAILTSGGALLTLARAHKVPHVVLPAGGVPRTALGFSTLGLAVLMGHVRLQQELSALKHTLQPMEQCERAETLATVLADGAVLYASSVNRVVAENWKIALNETGKVPAFWNIFPEATHNEIEMFDRMERNVQKIPAVFFEDAHDHVRVLQRMQHTRTLLRTRGVTTERIELAGNTFLERIFNTILLGHWTAFFIATRAGQNPERVALITELKARMKT